MNVASSELFFAHVGARLRLSTWPHSIVCWRGRAFVSNVGRAQQWTYLPDLRQVPTITFLQQLLLKWLLWPLLLSKLGSRSATIPFPDIRNHFPVFIPCIIKNVVSKLEFTTRPESKYICLNLVAFTGLAVVQMPKHRILNLKSCWRSDDLEFRRQTVPYVKKTKQKRLKKARNILKNVFLKENTGTNTISTQTGTRTHAELHTDIA